MTRELFLASGGLSAMTRYRNSGAKQLLLIPTAAHGPDEAEPEWLTKDREALDNLGFDIKTAHLVTMNSGEVTSALAAADIVFVAGGNTYQLLQEMHRVKFADALAEASNVIYSGSSAGAVVATPDIGYIGDLDDPAAAPLLANTVGLGLVEFGVMPHSDRPGFLEAFDALQTRGTEFPILPITDSQAVVVSDGTAAIVDSL